MSTQSITLEPIDVGFPAELTQHIPNPRIRNREFFKELENDLDTYSSPLKLEQYALIKEGERVFSIFSKFKKGEEILLPCEDLRVALRDTFTLDQLKKVFAIEKNYFLHLFWRAVSKAAKVEMPKDLQLNDVEEDFQKWFEDHEDAIVKIERLELEERGIRKLPPHIGKLTGLKELTIHHGWLEEIPQEIGKLTELETFYIRANPIEKLPEEMSYLTKLKKITIWSCHELTEVPLSLQQLPSLEHFQATESALEEIPKFASTALNVLLLNGNPCHKDVEHVPLGGCSICKFPESDLYR